jgi:hypothetical protein
MVIGNFENAHCSLLVVAAHTTHLLGKKNHGIAEGTAAKSPFGVGESFNSKQKAEMETLRKPMHHRNIEQKFP